MLSGRPADRVRLVSAQEVRRLVLAPWAVAWRTSVPMFLDLGLGGATRGHGDTDRQRLLVLPCCCHDRRQISAVQTGPQRKWILVLATGWQRADARPAVRSVSRVRREPSRG
ncbi:MAG: hypothetical protein QOF87_3079 [Pseudonocardiales bacterium]|jgi:hypothetical protein|nr:hypothetical protein [Pseudonocardiales bacterium]